MTHPRLNFAGLLAEFATTLLEIYESKQMLYLCNTLAFERTMRSAT